MSVGDCKDALLLQKLGSQENQELEIGPRERPGDYVNGSTLSQVIRAEWARNTGTPLTALTVRGLRIHGLVDLESCGSEGKPTIKLRFLGCRFVGGLSFVHSYLKSLSLEHCILFNSTSHGPSKIDGRRCVIVEQLFINDLLFYGPCSSLDLAGAKLSRGCALNKIGNRRNALDRPQSRDEWISFKGARIDGDLEINELSLHNYGWEHKVSALNLERASVTGTLAVVSNRNKADSIPDIVGQVNLRSAKIGGRVRFESLHIQAPPNPNSVEHNQPSAIFGRLMVVAGDFLFRRTDDETSRSNGKERRDVQINGQVDFSDARIEGDLDFRGVFQVENRIRALRCRRSIIGGHLRFGRLLVPSGSFGCNVVGETDFTGTKVGGTVTFSGSRHRMSRVLVETIKNSRHKQGQSVNFRYAKLARDIRFESGENRCFLEGLSLIGASIEGRLLIGGTFIRARLWDGQERKAITANGAIIHGGIEIKEDEHFDGRHTIISGDIRLRNARVDGPFVVRGAYMTARSRTNQPLSDAEDSFRRRGVAIWASNTKFGGDVLFHPSAKYKTTIVGELRFWGATIDGSLFIQGITLRASKETVTALDCYTADIKKGVDIRYYAFGDNQSPKARPTHIEGIVSFSFAKLQSLRIGSEPKLIEPRNDDERKAREDDKQNGNAGETETTLRGVLLLRNLHVEGTTTLENLVLQHPGRTAMSIEIKRRLEELQVFREHTVVHANYANFGSRLYVNLNENKSVGLINLFAASTGTIGGQTGDERDLRLRENWGTPRKRWASSDDPIGAGKAWGTLPLAGDVANRRILLNLDEFKYSRVNDPTESEPWEVRGWDRFTRRWIWGQPFAEDVGPRFDWLQRQVNNPSDPDRAVISPYQQLAKVYREQGHLQRANNIVRARRWLQLVSAPEKDQSRFGRIRPVLQTWIDRAFSALFGFGYSPARALTTLVLIWVCSCLLVSFAVSDVAEKLRPSAPAAQSGNAPTIPPTVTTHKIEHSWNGTSKSANDTSDDASAQRHSGMSTRGRKEQSYSVITEEIATPTPATPATEKKVLACRGFLCNASDHSEASACHLPHDSSDIFNVMTEASKVILPFTRLNSGASCSLKTDTPFLFRFFHFFLELLSWILFPLAAVTFSGILREKSDG